MLNVPHSGQTQKSTSPPVLRHFKLSKRLTQKYAKLLSIILRPKVTPVYVTSCESCKQASNNDSILIPGLKFDNMNLGETNFTLTHRKQQMSVETFFYFDVIVECDRST